MLPHSINEKRTFGLLEAATLAAATLMATLAIGADTVRAGDLIVRYDQSQILRLPRPVSELIVGNPSIADVTIQSGDLLVVTGKTFGVTNVIALDADRNVIQDQRIVVQRDEQRMVNLMKGSARQSFSCTPVCQPTITIGDDPVFFDTISKHSSQKTKFSETGSDGGSNNGQ